MTTLPSKTIKYNQLKSTLELGLFKITKKTIDFFKILGASIDRDTLLQFKTEGARGGKKWKTFSPNTLRMPSGKFRIRYGTDKKGRPKGSYTPGVYRSGIRRYSESSKLLQASGLFKSSFSILSLSKDRLLYGTKHKLAGVIGSNPERQVLVVNSSDKIRYKKIYDNYIKKEMIF